MSLSQLLLAVLLILLGVSWLGWVAVSATVLGVIALVTGVLLILEGTSVFVWRTPVVRTRD